MKTEKAIMELTLCYVHQFDTLVWSILTEQDDGDEQE